MQPVSAPATASIIRVSIISNERETTDLVAVEEPLEIRIGFPDGTHTAVSITMRTPGNDAELAAGFLFTEGILTSADQIMQIRHCGLKIGKVGNTLDRAAALNSNTIRVDLAEGVDIDLDRLKRNFYTTSSCGVCGKSSIDALRMGISHPLEPDLARLDASLLHAFPKRLREVQEAFDKTGGLHASALFDANGTLDIVREDVGRHNALDKVIGANFLEGKMPLSDRILLVSGRASFELVQKALMAGIPFLAAVGAPSSLAVELANEYGMTLVGFLRDEKYNIYSAPQRCA
jgi:FdhD protein